MKLELRDPPRAFSPRPGARMHDCARIELEPNEQVTFVTESGAEYDLARTPWGFYATPSLNGRLARFGLRALLVRSRAAKFFILLVENGKEDELDRYLEAEGHSIVCWLDSDKALTELETLRRGSRAGA